MSRFRLRSLLRQDRLRWLTWGLVAVGVVLRAIHLLANRSLWYDEAMLALNILDRGFVGLARPLDMVQSAPVGYLWAVELSTLLFGHGEIALRLPAFLAGVGTLLLLVPLARRLLSPAGVPVAAGLAACSAPLVYYAAEVKPYAVDALGAAALLFVGAVGLGLDSGGARAPSSPGSADPAAPGRPGLAWWILLLTSGVLVQLLSYPSVFVLAGVGTVLGVHFLVRGEREAQLRLAGVVGVWLGVFVALYVAFYGGAAGGARMRGFWTHGFVPWEEGPGAVWSWFLSRDYIMVEVVGSSLLPPALLVLVAVAGAVGLVRSGRGRGGALLLAPVLFLLIAAGAARYPFAERLVLFLAVPAVLLIGQGLTGFRSVMPAGVLVGALLVLVFARRTVQELPFARESMRPLLERVEERREPGTPIHLQDLAIPTGTYYADRMDLEGVVLSAGRLSRFQHLEAREATLEELAARPRAWVVFSHWVLRDDRPRVLGHLRERGILADSVTLPGSAAYLYVRGQQPLPPGP